MVISIAIPTLETDRLLLRPLRESDFEDYAALYADPEVTRHLGSGGEPWDRGRAWRNLAFQEGHWLFRGTGLWAVEHWRTGAFLGVIGFAAPEGWPGFELAWALARRWWGQGYATEGARAALAHAFDVLGKDRVISLIAPENWASIASRSGSASGWKAVSSTSDGRCCAMASTARPTAPRPRTGRAAPAARRAGPGPGRARRPPGSAPGRATPR